MRLKSLGVLAMVAVGLSLPATFDLDVCGKGTLVDVNTGKIVCVGPVVQRGKEVNLDELISDCYEQNPKWTGVVAFHPNGMECY